MKLADPMEAAQHDTLQFEENKSSKLSNTELYPTMANSLLSVKPLPPEPEIDRKQAKIAFKSAIKKIEQVRNISSPILKVITV